MNKEANKLHVCIDAMVIITTVLLVLVLCNTIQIKRFLLFQFLAFYDTLYTYNYKEYQERCIYLLSKYKNARKLSQMM